MRKIIINKICRSALFLLFITLMLSMLTGCGGNAGSSVPDTSADVAIVLGAGSNRHPAMIKTAMENHKVRDAMAAACENGGSVTFIVNESQPNVKTANIDAIGAGYSGGQRKKIVSQRLEELTAVVAKLKATSAEANLIKAIRAAASAVHSGNGQSKHIIVIDTALAQTTGLLSFSDINVAQTDTEAVIGYLKNEDVFDTNYINLEGVDCQWFGFTSTAAPQAEMTADMAKHMRSFWEDFFNNCGGKVNINSSADGTDKAKDNLPPVNTVYVPQSDPSFLKTAVKLDEGKLLFLPDSTDFADKDKAISELTPYSQQLLASDQDLLIAGMVASTPTNAGASELSLARAEAVKDQLVRLGVAQQHLHTIGLGVKDNPFRVIDLNADGSVNRSAAKLNRAIIMVAYDSDTAAELIRIANS